MTGNKDNKFKGEKLKQIRTKQNMTMTELAKKLFIPDSARKTISKYENNQQRPTFQVVEQLSKIFKVEITHFY